MGVRGTLWITPKLTVAKGDKLTKEVCYETIYIVQRISRARNIMYVYIHLSSEHISKKRKLEKEIV